MLKNPAHRDQDADNAKIWSFFLVYKYISGNIFTKDSISSFCVKSL